MRKWIQRVKCWCGYHGKTRTFLMQHDQRVLVFTCADCDKVIQKTRMTKAEAKSVRELGRKFGKFP